MPVGHNSGLLDENERKALFFDYVRKRMAIDAKIKTLRTERKESGAEAQSHGVVLQDMDFAIKAMTTEDKSKISDRYLSHGEILGWLGMVQGFQADLLRDRAPAMERIETEGQIAGLAALKRKSGYAPKSDEDITWERGYAAGQKIMRDNLQAAMTKRNEQKSAEVVKMTGRRRKSTADEGPEAA